MGLLFRAAPLVWIMSTVYQVLATESALESRWRALQVNCTVSASHHSEVSVSEAKLLFDEFALGRPHRAQWLHDLGDWHLRYSGNLTRAEEFLRAGADMGHAMSQFLVGALAATSETPNQVESAVFYQFASRGGSIQASMALGYRHLVGYHATKACESALRYYKTVADDVMRHKHALPNQALPVQVFSIPDPVLLTDNQNDLPRTNEDERAGVEYLRQRCATSSNAALFVRTASLILFSDLYQDNTKPHADAQREAVVLLERAAGLGSVSAMALLGHVHAYGLAGMRIDMTMAIHHYEKGFNASSSDQDEDKGLAEAANGLGMLYLRGVEGNPSDVERAMSYFKIAAQHGHAEGVYNAADVMSQVDPVKSIQFLEASADVGHVGAIFRLARVKEKHRFRRRAERESGCDAIAKHYKRVAEHNQYGRELLKRAGEAFLRGRYEHSLRLYRIAAELGYEAAEQNALWLLERYVFSTPMDAVSNAHYGQLVDRGIAQKNVDAVVRAGDVEFTKRNYRSAMKQYLRAMDWDPSHARALFSAGYMCQWGLGTVHSGRSLERARSYYTQAQENDPTLAYALPLLILAIDLELVVNSYMARIEDIIVWASNTVAARFKRMIDLETTKGELVFDESTYTSDMPVHFVSAMAFDGKSSSVIVDTTHPSNMKGVTLEMSLWIENSSKYVDRREGTTQVLLEWPSTLRVELVPHSDGTSWQVRVLGSASYESVLTMTRVALRTRRWYRITLVFDAANAKAVLALDGQVADSGNLLVFVPTKFRRSLIHVGHSPGPTTVPQSTTDVFHGKLKQYRVWSVALAGQELSNQAANHDTAPDSLWIDLQFEVSPNAPQRSTSPGDDNRIIDSRQLQHASEVTAYGVKLKMVRLPAPR